MIRASASHTDDTDSVFSNDFSVNGKKLSERS